MPSFRERLFGGSREEAPEVATEGEISIKGAQDFEQLYAAIRAQERIINDRGKEKNPEREIEIIEELRKSVLGDGSDRPFVTGYSIDSVTRAMGIREKVRELLGGEKIEE